MPALFGGGNDLLQRASVDDGLEPYVSAQRGSNKHQSSSSICRGYLQRGLQEQRVLPPFQRHGDGMPKTRRMHPVNAGRQRHRLCVMLLEMATTPGPRQA